MRRVVTVSLFEVVSPAGADEGFPSVLRLHKTDEYSSVFAFRRAIKGKFLILHYRPNGLGQARLGVVVAKKLARRANTRNLVKRIVREQFRRRRMCLSAVDMVIRLHAPVALATRRMLNEDVLRLMERLPDDSQ